MKVHGSLKPSTKPMRRSAWKKSARPREKKGPGLAQRVATFLGINLQHGKKQGYWRSVHHRMNVAALPCAWCGRAAPSQAAHLNLLAAGKGRGIKPSDALVVPLCADGFMRIGCHRQLDQGAAFDKSTAAAMQIRWLEQTRTSLKRLGQWPHEAEQEMIRHLGAYLERSSV